MSAEKMMRSIHEPFGGSGEESEIGPLIKSNGKFHGIGRRSDFSACLAKRAHPMRDVGELCAAGFESWLSCENHDANLAQRCLQVAYLRFIQPELALKFRLHP